MGTQRMPDEVRRDCARHELAEAARGLVAGGVVNGLALQTLGALNSRLPVCHNDRELAQILDGARQAARPEPARVPVRSDPEIQKPSFQTFSVSEIFEVETPDSDRILGDNLINLGEMALIVGPPDVGKSRIVVQLIFSMLLGLRFWLESLPIHRNDLRILLVQTENSARRLKADFAPHLRGILPRQREIVEENFRTTCFSAAEIFSLNAERLSATVQDFNPDLVFIDPLGDFLFNVKNENDAMEMRQGVRLLQRAIQGHNPKTSIGLVQHARSGKHAAAGALDWDRGAFARGSKALASMVRSQINVAPGDGDGRAVIVSCGKCNNGRKFDPIAVELDQESMRYVKIDDFDLDAWRREVGNNGGGSTQPKDRLGALKGILDDTPGLSYSELVREIMAVEGVSERTAKNRIGDARALGLISDGRSEICLRA